MTHDIKKPAKTIWGVWMAVVAERETGKRLSEVRTLFCSR
jgi:hypothetical protein